MALHGGSSVAGVGGIPALAFGTYTPVLTNGANVSASVTSLAQYLRVGNVVTVSGRIQLTMTAVGVATIVDLSLPFASNFANVPECAGVAASVDAAGAGAGIYAEVTSDRARMQSTAFATGAHDFYYQFTYQVI